MGKTRQIIEIDEEKCNGCGECIIACAEGALQLVDGKAKLVSDIYCDGLGACLGECPTGALKIIEREAAEFDEEAVEKMLHEKAAEVVEAPSGKEELPCGCPGSMSRTLEREDKPAADDSEARSSELGQWPIKLQLLGPHAGFLHEADLVLVADCVGFAYPEVHRRILRDHVIALGCPKLDDLDAHVERLAMILEGTRPRSLTVVHMEVPCCHGFVYAAKEAIKKSGVDLPLKRIQIGVGGELQSDEELTL